MKLRIIQIVVCLFSWTGCLICAVDYDLEPDPEVERILKSPSAVERFKAAKARMASTGSSRISPLEQEAQKFSQIINPPAPAIVKRKPVPPQPPRPPRPPRPVVKPRPVPPPVRLLGTCINVDNPAQSSALIEDYRQRTDKGNPPRRGPHWVGLNQDLDGLRITMIGDDRVVVEKGTGKQKFTVVTQPVAAQARNTAQMSLRLLGTCRSDRDPTSPSALIEIGGESRWVNLQQAVHGLEILEIGEKHIVTQHGNRRQTFRVVPPQRGRLAQETASIRRPQYASRRSTN